MTKVNIQNVHFCRKKGTIPNTNSLVNVKIWVTCIYHIKGDKPQSGQNM